MLVFNTNPAGIIIPIVLIIVIVIIFISSVPRLHKNLPFLTFSKGMNNF